MPNSTVCLSFEFDWMHRYVDGGILTVTLHPQVIGHAHRIAMPEM